jgi:hypothetical protein
MKEERKWWDWSRAALLYTPYSNEGYQEACSDWMRRNPCTNFGSVSSWVPTNQNAKVGWPSTKNTSNSACLFFRVLFTFFFKHLFSRTTVSIDKTKDIEQNIGILTGIPHLVPGLCW